MNYHFSERGSSVKRCVAARIRALPPHPACACCLASAHSALTGTAMRGAAIANDLAPTARVSGVVAAAVAVTADLSTACRGGIREVRCARIN